MYVLKLNNAYTLHKIKSTKMFVVNKIRHLSQIVPYCPLQVINMYCILCMDLEIFWNMQRDIDVENILLYFYLAIFKCKTNYF